MKVVIDESIDQENGALTHFEVMITLLTMKNFSLILNFQNSPYARLSYSHMSKL